MAAQRPPARQPKPQEPAPHEPQSILLPVLDSRPEPEPDYEKTLEKTLAPRFVFPSASLPKRAWPRGRFVTTVLTLSCLILLVAGSLVAYAFINNKSVPGKQILTIQPNLVRVNDFFTLSGKGFGINDLISFTHDKGQPLLNGNGRPLQTHADDLGTFSVQVMAPSIWEVGQHSIYAIDIGKEQSISVLATLTIEGSSLAPPLLQLSSSSLDLGTSVPGVVSKKMITLINAGGKYLTWQASSDQPWLIASPGSGTFSGEAAVDVMANSGSLPPQFYKGHITFRQLRSSDPPLILTVTMMVKSAPPASLAVSPASLTYSGTPSQNPAAQSIALRNNSAQPLDWSSNIGNNSASWLSVNPGSDHLKAHASETVTVYVQSQQLAIGSYQGTINFKGGVNPQVTVFLNIAAPGNLIASPPALNFTSLGQNPATQTIAISNSGGVALDWTASTAATGGANWLNAAPSSGFLAPNATANVTVSVNAASLKPGSYQETLIFNYGGLTSQVAVSLTVAVPPTPGIGLSQQQMNFTTIKGSNPAPQAFTIKNTGQAVLNWAIAEDQNGATFAPTSSKSGSLAPGQSTVITVTPQVSQASGGTLTASITVLDSDGGTKVVSQKITVNIVVKDQAVIALSPGAMAFSHDSSITYSTQFLTIANAGSQSLNWAVQSSQSWLFSDTTSGSLNPGASISLELQCGSGALSPGTYTATFSVSDSDTGTPVAAQSIVVTLVVS